MELNLDEIMELPRPPGSINIGSLKWYWQCYVRLLSSYLKQDIPADSPHSIRRVAYFQSQINTCLRDLKLGKMYNHGLRIKSWVLSCKARRLELRAAIGEQKIGRWQALVEARLAGIWVSRAAVNDGTNAETSEEKTPAIEHLSFSTSSHQRPWYRLASLPKLPPDQSAFSGFGALKSLAAPSRASMSRASTSRASMYRPIPAIPFWPHELVADYIADDEALGGFQDDFKGDFQSKYYTGIKRELRELHPLLQKRMKLRGGAKEMPSWPEEDDGDTGGDYGYLAEALELIELAKLENTKPENPKPPCPDPP